MIWQRITRNEIFRVLAAGFTLVIVMLLAIGFVGVRNIRSIQESAASLAGEQLVMTRLIDQIERDRAMLRAVLLTLARDPELADERTILSQLNEIDQHIEHIVAATSGTPEEPLWRELHRATTGFSAEARRLVALEDPPERASRGLLRWHEDVVATIRKLTEASYQKAMVAQNRINVHSEALVRRSLVLLGAGLLLAIVCAALTMRVTAELFRRMAWQAGELSRVSWQMLENQETTARRFSHELHDELGQCLTAVKANLTAIHPAQGVEQSRIKDCLELVDGAIRNVRELSQLLHPTILDDFGLDASLRWLCERFTQRTGIDVEYSSNFTERLSQETEAHLFRIAQEALTNLRRHSGADHARMQLRSDADRIYLSIADNGRGLDGGGDQDSRGLGMIGMRARARSLGGEVTVRSAPEKGVTIDVWVPSRSAEREEKDPNLVSR